jgi:hypothetical protein
LLRLEIGVDTSSRGLRLRRGACTPNSSRKQRLTAYAVHPEHHLRVKTELEGLRIARHQVDYDSAARQGLSYQTKRKWNPCV